MLRKQYNVYDHEMLDFLITSMTFVHRLYRQVVSTSCVSLLADQSVYAYESELQFGLARSKVGNLAKRFG